MNNKRRVAAFMAAVMFLLGGAAKAAEPYSVETTAEQKETVKLIDKIEVTDISGNTEERKITVRGKIPISDGAGDLERQVTLQVFKPKADFVNGDPEKILHYMRQTKASTSGAYEFVFRMNGASGTYTFRINYPGAGDLAGRQEDLVYLSPTEFVKMFEAINAAVERKDAGEMKSAIDTYVEKGILSLPMYDELEKAQIPLMPVFEYMVRTAGFHNDATMVVARFNEGAALQMLNTAKSADGAEQILNDIRFKNIFRLSESVMGTYKGLDMEKISDVMNEMLGKSFQTFEQVQSTFNKTVIFAALRGQHFLKFETVLRGNSEVLGISFANYDKLLSSQQVLSNLGDNISNYKTLKELADGFNEFVKEASESSGSGGNGGGNGGGGSGGGYRPNSSRPSNVSEEYDVSGADESENVIFYDLEDVPWAVEAIEGLYSAGVVNGRGGGMFYPDETITREEFLKMLIAGLELEQEGATCNFADVRQTDWYYSGVASGAALGIVNGIEAGVFGVGRSITREEIAVMSYRAMKLMDVFADMKEEFTGFSDVAAERYSYPAICVMQREGIINGIGDGKFAPMQTATRAEAAKIIYGLFVRIYND